MQGKTKERWMELCELAAVEHDSDALIALAREIGRTLEEKDNRLKHEQAYTLGRLPMSDDDFYKSWEEIAAAAAKETNPERLLELTKELERALDERNKRFHVVPRSKPPEQQKTA